MAERRTAHWWVVSDHPEAKQWREAARGGAFLGMVNRALSDHEKGKIFGQPHPETHSVIEKPATVAQNFFQVPEQQIVKKGTFFDVPVKETGPVMGGLINGDWLSEDGFVKPSWEENDKKPTKAAQAATYFSIPTENV